MKRLLIYLICVLTLIDGIGIYLLHSGGTQGYWRVSEITAGEVVMTEKDGDTLGLKLGHFYLKKDGTAEVELIEETFEGKWKEKNGEITVKYGDHTAKGERKGKKLTLTDEQTVTYKARNNFR